jgi:hypothetical protein
VREASEARPAIGLMKLPADDTLEFRSSIQNASDCYQAEAGCDSKLSR